MRSTIIITAFLTSTLAGPTPNDCPDVGSRGFFPFAFTAFNDVTGKQASTSFYFDDHSRQFRYQFADTALENNGTIKATRLQSLTYFEYDSYACSVYDSNGAGTIGRFDKTLAWGDLVLNGGQEADITDWRILCDSLIIWYPKQYNSSARAA